MLKKIFLGLLALLFLSQSTLAQADEIVVSGNGDGSTNNVNISSNSNTETTQTNTANVTNNVDVNANTGGNEANSNNGGETSITTGDVNVSSNIENNNINGSYVESGCCTGGVSAEISGNASDSNNSISYNQGHNVGVSINNNAYISNNVKGYANTGENKANKNSGNVSIDTGNIKATDTIKNKFINIYGVSALTGNGGEISLKISNNGAGSVNTIAFASNNNVDVDIVNSATILNNSEWDLNTGRNEANSNMGDVAIVTGDIEFTSHIENGPVNVGWVDVECCEEDNGGPVVPPDVTPPTNPPGTSGGGGSSIGGGGAGGTSTGQVLAAMLPVTGGSWVLFLAISSILMFFMGGYLRLRSGRSPNLSLLLVK